MPTVLDALDVDGVDFAVDDLDDLHATLAGLRSRRGYAVVPFAGTRAIVLLTHELVAAAFKDETVFPAAAVYRLTTEPVLGRTLQCLRGRDHRTARAIVSPPFRRSRVAELVGPVLEPAAHELVDRFAARGHAELVAEFTTRYPVLVICRLLGVPVRDEDTVRRWAHDLFRYPLDPEPALRASREFTEYATEIVAHRRRHPGRDIVSMLVTDSCDGELLDDEQVLAFLRLLFPAGSDTTMLALANTLSALLTHPAQHALLAAAPDEWTEWAVWEGLRWEPPVGLLPRLCPEATRWQGIDIPAMTPIIFSVNAAHRDPARYAQPDEFDITRRQPVQLSFGQGPHSCVGNWLALAELTTALRVLVRRLPGLRLDPDAADAARISARIGTALRGPRALHVRW